ncbi:MAG: NADH:flavin oxidoreductase/NADH oxidase family protein [Candidatus Marinimicrobia bacterium]|jgi:2,4-dienoyl-CoA reductase-like NADH-dependent reductase (Old Yellow Enzyme family)|nr:NADH:flavin oxidoreductase/NADH oxidase family protein [Candidatus Neomarinimicrobiota bacterium]MBT3683619.1 NADH:flavin oxidoreductase/NADH oxidase family protein [Candidatus Neomarinimicrobiota bacterium]MBT3760398.1 NADH:flavin oxidoreductase/NADH oxidase family protein [Candidatus Neomarinimicrobiota bacterium]MBT3896524.1 NADH:flavin oxidoreductase/NADH oxidase family protein [Candidatus Neomarinimicrobiota bacterium]MBT4173562.1 NADH:flavin oxidoreductase/NADH oxidase family protein [
MNKSPINTSIKLPCGVTLNNRLVKSAMTERISNRRYESTKAHEIMYRDWSKTGAGLLITGNVMFDRKHLESSGNICFDDENMLPKLKKWAEAGKSTGNHIWVQISHAGRQTNKFCNGNPLAPSAVQLKKLGLFGKPKVMTEEDIQNIISGFSKAAKITKEAGFTGLQIHSAHGYLLSQFLSPNANKRTDRWGGSLENRSRMLIAIIREVRKVVGAGFPISIKLNSSDFQRGGFTEEDSLEVVRMLDREKIDLLEISGGTYEKVVFLMANENQADVKESTKKREAYFIDFARKVKSISNIPLLITGGFRSYNFCNEVLKNEELDLVGMARPFITNREDIPGFLSGKVPKLNNIVLRTGIKQFDDAAEGGFYAKQLIRFSKGKMYDSEIGPVWSSIFLVLHEIKMALSKRF